MKVNLLMAGKYIFVFIFGIICGLFIKQQKSHDIDGVPKTEALEIKGAGESSVYGIVGNIKNTSNTNLGPELSEVAKEKDMTGTEGLAKGSNNSKDSADKPFKQIYEIAAQGDFEKVKAIIKSGAIINPSYDLKKKYGGNPLFAAVYNGHYNIISVLLNNGANVNARDVNGETPLDWAISRNDIKSDLMLRSGGGKTSMELDLSK
ncbi:MAG: hypothetical protein CMO75_03125 [Verrucomicrobiales bacterium]|nr:hypothetical protein [Verrucomicrobiales bacterium]